MSDTPVDPLSLQQLRVQAEFLRREGRAPVSHGHVLSAEALAVLFRLANSSDSAADCLKILHELQTHQIELDLQLEQSDANERENVADLARYKSFYEFAPVGYLIINRAGRICETNRAGAALFGVACADLDGQPFENLLAPASRQIFTWQLKKLFSGSPGETCSVRAMGSSEAPLLRVLATLAPDGEMVLMTISEQQRAAAS